MYNPTSPRCTVHICLDGCLPFEHGYLTRDCTLLKKYDSSHKGINCQQRHTGVGLHTHLLLAVGILSALSLHSPCACCHSCEFKCSAALLCACSYPTLLVLLKQFLACTWVHTCLLSLPAWLYNIWRRPLSSIYPRGLFSAWYSAHKQGILDRTMKEWLVFSGKDN